MSIEAGTAARSGAVTLFGQAGRLVLLLLNLVILGRLLTPADFGLFAMVLAIVGVAELLRDLGLTSGAIQANTLTAAQKSNLFWLNTALGLALSATFAGLAPLAALLYGDPRLAFPMAVLSITFLLNGLQAQFQVELARSHRFGILAATDVVSQVLGLATGITLALLGWGYWSLVLMQVVTAFMCAAMRISVASWWPHLPRRAASVRHIISFGWKLSIAQALGYLANNAAIVSLGLRGYVADAGVYSRSGQLVSIPVNQIFGPLTNVALSSLSREPDPVRFTRVMTRLMVVVGYAGAIVFSAIVALAPGGTVLLLGPDWAEAVLPLQILSIAMMFQSLTFPFYWALLAKGQVSALLAYNVVSKGLTVVLVVLGSSHGVWGAAAGYAIGLAVSWPLCVAWSTSAMRGRYWAHLLIGLRPTLLFGFTAAVAGAAGHFIHTNSDFLRLLLGLGAWIGCLAVSVTLRPVRTDLMSAGRVLAMSFKRTKDA